MWFVNTPPNMTEVWSLWSLKLVLVGVDLWGEISSTNKLLMTCVINTQTLEDVFPPATRISCVAFTQEMIRERNMMEVVRMMVSNMLRYEYCEYFWRMSSMTSVLTQSMNVSKSNPIPLWLWQSLHLMNNDGLEIPNLSVLHHGIWGELWSKMNCRLSHLPPIGLWPPHLYLPLEIST